MMKVPGAKWTTMYNAGRVRMHTLTVPELTIITADSRRAWYSKIGRLRTYDVDNEEVL